MEADQLIPIIIVLLDCDLEGFLDALTTLHHQQQINIAIIAGSGLCNINQLVWVEGVGPLVDLVQAMLGSCVPFLVGLLGWDKHGVIADVFCVILTPSERKNSCRLAPGRSLKG